MSKYVKALAIFLIFGSAIQAQDFGKFFQADQYDFHTGVDSIVSTKYMINEYADEASDFTYTHEGNEMQLHSFGKTVLVYTDPLSSVSTSTSKHNERVEVVNLTFNEAGLPTYMKIENSTFQTFNEEKFYTYDDKGRLITQVRKGFNKIEYERGNEEIYTDTLMQRVYGENNLVESIKVFMEMGMTMNIESENVGDTLRYLGEMKMSGMLADKMSEAMPPPPPGARKHVMDVMLNKETGNYEAIEKKRGGMTMKQIIDQSGKTIESILSSKDGIVKHEKFTYQNNELTAVELLKGESGNEEAELNDKGQIISQQTRYGRTMYEYDEKGNCVKEVLLDPYNEEFQEVFTNRFIFEFRMSINKYA